MNNNINFLISYIKINFPYNEIITTSDHNVYVRMDDIIKFDNLSGLYDMSDRDSDNLHRIVENFNNSHPFEIDWKWVGMGYVVTFYLK